MTNLLKNLRAQARKRAAYNRTVAEIAALPYDIALDLGIDPADARTLARRAVYGA